MSRPAKLLFAILLAGFAWPAHAQLARPRLSSCDARELTRYIGKPYAELQRIRPDKARYVCSTCAMTMDFRADRLTVTYDRKSLRITRLQCG